jgi:hypothetical protein
VECLMRSHMWVEVIYQYKCYENLSYFLKFSCANGHWLQNAACTSKFVSCDKLQTPTGWMFDGLWWKFSHLLKHSIKSEVFLQGTSISYRKYARIWVMNLMKKYIICKYENVIKWNPLFCKINNIIADSRES